MQRLQIHLLQEKKWHRFKTIKSISLCDVCKNSAQNMDFGKDNLIDV